MSQSTRESYRERILRVLVYLEKRLDEPVSLEELAAVAHFSPFHFHRTFTGMVGESVKSHIRRLRLERAASALLLTRRSVTDIGLEAGYEAHAAFSRVFKTVFGQSPSAYRHEGRSRLLDRERRSPSLAGERFLTNVTGGREMEVSITQLPVMKAAFVRHVGPYAACGQAWGALCAWAGPKGLLGPDTEFFSMCHDDPEITPAEKLRYDACVRLSREVAPEGAVGVTEVGGGEYATTRHVGPYEKLYETYVALFGVWGPQSGREFAGGPSLEFYRNDPANTPPEELITDICVRLEAL